ncbi:hypothetical protein BDN70DRAFT_880613 [Pholiota conissans]|uniref:DUF6534 domain-containing protein n=1 Tax=Pholiota conissans TaxID=109636 RepID=A0A9P5YYM9_9AGAR|nr:hypothetical protein BDN70DRAFT_880613 [Pholiota conissans]
MGRFLLFHVDVWILGFCPCIRIVLLSVNVLHVKLPNVLPVLLGIQRSADMVPTTLQNTLGAVEIGSSVSVFLFGIVTMQCYLYFSHYEDDRMGFKALVTFIWILELAHTIAIGYEVYRTTITLYGVIDQSTVKYAGFGVVTILGGIITTTVQFFFAYRVFNVLPNPWRFVGPACMVVAFFRLVVSIYTGIRGITSPYNTVIVELKPFVTALLASGAVIDIVIAISMLYFLFERRENSFSKISRLIDRLISFTIRTGLLTSVAAIFILILYRIMPYNFIYMAAYISLAKVYSNTLLSALNSRKALRKAVANSMSVERAPHRSEHVITTPGGVASIASQPYYNPISIEMKTSTYKTLDLP